MLYSLDDLRPEIHEEAGFVAPDAALIGKVRMMKGASVWFKAVLRGDNDWIIVGQNSNVQDGSVLHTDLGDDLVIGRNVTVGHKAILHGCSIADDVLIGMGSIILGRTTIGSNSIVGANSFIPEGRSIPEGVLVLGSPAKVVRDLREEEIAAIRASADFYAANAIRYANSLQEIDK